MYHKDVWMMSFQPWHVFQQKYTRSMFSNIENHCSNHHTLARSVFEPSARAGNTVWLTWEAGQKVVDRRCNIPRIQCIFEMYLPAHIRVNDPTAVSVVLTSKDMHMIPAMNLLRGGFVCDAHARTEAAIPIETRPQRPLWRYNHSAALSAAILVALGGAFGRHP